MEKPREEEKKYPVFGLQKLPDNTTDQLFYIYDKEAYQIFRRYLLTDRVFGHPGTFNPDTEQYDKLNLDYQLIVRESKMIISRSDKPIIPVNEKITEKERRKSQSNAMLYREMISVSGQHARGQTTTYELSDSYLDELEDRAGYERLILEGKMIEYVLLNYMSLKQQAVIIWFSHKDSFKVMEKSEAFQEFRQKYSRYIDYLNCEDPNSIRKYLYYSVRVLIRQIIWYQQKNT